MGGTFSCYCTESSEPLDCIRVIHINGYIQDFLSPVTAAQITGKPPKHVLCTSAQLVSMGPRSLRPQDHLESGRIYFLLPHSVFQSDSSPLDLASLATRLNAAARRAGPADPVKAGPVSDPGKGDIRLGVGLPQGKMVWSQPRTWKPVLETIREISFRRRESPVSKGSVGSVREIEE